MTLPYLLFFMMNTFCHPAYSAYIQPATTMQLANESSQIVPLQVTEEYPKCFEVALIRSRMADSRDCQRAVMMLPTTDDSGDFNSDSGTPNQFLLPVSKIYKSCNVTVSMDRGLQDQCSWSTIESMAFQLVQTCSAGYYPDGVSGGINFVGKRGHIRVAMGKIGYILTEINVTASSGGIATS